MNAGSTRPSQQLQATTTPSKPGEPLDEWKQAYLPLLGYCQQLAGKTADARATYR